MALTPLQEPTFFILTALAEQPRYGYEVIQTVKDLSNGRITLRAGTLYGAFDRLTESELIEVAREEIVDGRMRRYYRLTDSGADVLASEMRRMRANAEAASRSLRTRNAGPSFARVALA